MDTAAVTAARVLYVLPDRKARKDHKAPQVPKGLRVFLDLKDRLALRVRRALPVSKVQRVCKDPRVFPAPKDQKGHKAPRVLLVLKGQRGRKDPRVLPVLKGQRGRKDPKVFPVLKGQKARKDPRGRRVLLLPSVFYLPTPPPRKACHPTVPWNLTATACSTEPTFPTLREAAPSPLPILVCIWSHSMVS